MGTNVWELVEATLLRRATFVAETYTGDKTDEEALDRYGDPVGIRIYAVRLGRQVIVIVHRSRRETGDEPYTSVECLAPFSDFEDAVQRVHDHYDYEDYECWISACPEELKDKCRSLGQYLDRIYEPTEGIPPTPPSGILNAIAYDDVVERPPGWAWFDGTLFLTASVLRRTGPTVLTACFDAFHSAAFGAMKVPVVNVELLGQQGGLSFADWIRASIRIKRVGRLESDLFRARTELEAAQRQQKELVDRITRLEAELHAAGGE